MSRRRRRITLIAVGSAAALALTGTVAASPRNPSPFYGDGHKHARYADYSTAGSPATRKAATSASVPSAPGSIPVLIPPPLLDSAGKPIPANSTSAKWTQAGTAKGHLIHVKSVAGPPAKASTVATTFTHSCNWDLGMVQALPKPPAAGNPFAVASQARNPLTGTNDGWVQADGTVPGQGQPFTSPLALVEYATGIDWTGGPASATASVSIKPSWHGSMALASTGFNLAFSSATGAFRASHGWYNANLKSWSTLANIRDAVGTVTDGATHHFYYDKSGTVAYTLGVNLVPNQVFFYYSQFETQVSAQSQFAAPAGAASDFGSAHFDTPASLLDSSGNSVNGYYRSGARLVTNLVTMTFTAPKDFIVIC